MSETEIEMRVRQIIAKELGLGLDKVSNDKKFVDDFGADSMQTTDLVMAIEDEFGFRIPSDESRHITTVQAAVDYAKSHAKKRAV